MNELKALQQQLSNNSTARFYADQFFSELASNKKAESDLKAIIKGIKEGTIDMITSDHNPINIENKKLELENSMFGSIGMESLFGSINLVLDLDQTIDCLTENPRKRFGLNQTKIAKGQKADLTLFNPDFKYIFSEDQILSKSKNSAFLGKELNGISYGIIANNQLILA